MNITFSNVNAVALTLLPYVIPRGRVSFAVICLLHYKHL